MTIYIITDGDYSDYHIIGVFLNEEQAEKAKLVTGGDIETYESDEIGKDNRYQYNVYFRSYKGKDSIDAIFEKNKSVNINEVRFYDNQFDFSCYSVIVMAEDKDHAIKIASDLVAQYKALI